MDQLRVDTERFVEEANQGANYEVQRTTGQQQSPPLCEKCMTEARRGKDPEYEMEEDIKPLWECPFYHHAQASNPFDGV